jgi:hypothetical protein
MNIKLTALASAFLMLTSTAAIAKGKHHHQALEFLDMEMIYEVNASDDDAEVVIYAKAPTGMRWFKVLNDQGHKIASLNVPKKHNPIGSQQVLIESAEPGVEEVKAGYPEGRYTFIGKTVDGDRLFGQIDFNHELLAPPVIHTCDTEVSVAEALLSWTVAGDADGIVVEIENDDLGIALTFELPGDAMQINLPAYLLEAGEEYDIGVGATNEQGNLVVSECSFSAE